MGYYAVIGYKRYFARNDVTTPGAGASNWRVIDGKTGRSIKAGLSFQAASDKVKQLNDKPQKETNNG
jgi:hypothetical protein